VWFFRRIWLAESITATQPAEIRLFYVATAFDTAFDILSAHFITASAQTQSLSSRLEHHGILHHSISRRDERRSTPYPMERSMLSVSPFNLYPLIILSFGVSPVMIALASSSH